jgi:hypothetical protein
MSRREGHLQQAEEKLKKRVRETALKEPALVRQVMRRERRLWLLWIAERSLSACFLIGALLALAIIIGWNVTTLVMLVSFAAGPVFLALTRPMPSVRDCLVRFALAGGEMELLQDKDVFGVDYADGREHYAVLTNPAKRD